jgi:hypothetical protein
LVVLSEWGYWRGIGSTTRRFRREELLHRFCHPKAKGQTGEYDALLKAPASKSEWLGFNAAQRWTVRFSASSKPVITRYIVDSLSPIANV